MELLTKEITRLAELQYMKGADLDGQNVVAKFFDPCGSWSWYLMNLDPEDNAYAWGIVSGFDVEMGSFSLDELRTIKGPLGLGIERDLSFRPTPAREVWEKLLTGAHV